MSETTRKLRKFGEGCEGHKLIDWYHMYLGMDLAADVIEAVEAQVAEAVARVEKLEKKFVTTTDKIEPAPVLRFKPGDRVRFVKDPRFARNYLGKTGEVRMAGALVRDYDYEIENIDGMGSIYANDADLEPAPVPVPAPRGFRVGDTITTRFSHGPQKVERIEEERIYYTRPGDAFQTWTVAKDATLVRAAAAPEAPAEDAGLAGRLTAERDDWKYAAEVQKKDTESWKARAEAAEKALDVERDSDYRVYLVTNEDGDSEGHWIAKTHWDALADFKRDTGTTEGEFSTVCLEGPGTKDWCRGWADGRPGEDEVHAITKKVRAECDALRLASLTWFNEKGEPELLATAEEVTERRKAAAKELAALRAKPRFRTRPVTEADLDELEREYNKADYKANEEYRAARALGFRRRVEQSK